MVVINECEFPDFRHKHMLVQFPSGERYICSGCREEGCNGGFKCLQPSCDNFMLHPECTLLPDVYRKPNHAGKKLVFCMSPWQSHNCSACENPIEGFLFKNSWTQSPLAVLWKGLRFHPLCIGLPNEFTFTEHENHRLKLVRYKDKDYTCCFCTKRISGWRYDCKQCRYSIDLTCAKSDIQGHLEQPPRDPAAAQNENERGFRGTVLQITGKLVASFVAGVAAKIAIEAID